MPRLTHPAFKGVVVDVDDATAAALGSAWTPVAAPKAPAKKAASSNPKK